MNNQPSVDASPKLMEGIISAIDIAIGFIENAGGSPFIPFVYTMDGGKPQIIKFLSPLDGHSAIGFDTPLNIEKGIEMAKGSIADLPPRIEYYAVTYDGYITVNREKTDAIIVNAGERGKGFGLYVIQRYRPATDDLPLERIGNPTYITKVESLW
jgi:hypothetical protein